MLESRILEEEHHLALRRGQFVCNTADVRSGDGDPHRTGRLGGGDGFPCRPVQPPLACLGDHEHAHWITLASSRSFVTSPFAASVGEPPIICDVLPFSGT